MPEIKEKCSNFVRSKGLQQQWNVRVPCDTPRQSDAISCAVYSLKVIEGII
jgi:hypothetical protein